MGIGEGKRMFPSTPTTVTVFKSASFPGDSSLMNLFRVRESRNAQENLIQRPPPPVAVVAVAAAAEEKVDLIQMLIKASPKKDKEEKETKEKEVQMQKVKVNTTRVTVTAPVKATTTPVVVQQQQLIPRSCQIDHAQEYKDISQHLKSLLNVSAWNNTILVFE